MIRDYTPSRGLSIGNEELKNRLECRQNEAFSPGAMKCTVRRRADENPCRIKAVPIPLRLWCRGDACGQFGRRRSQQRSPITQEMTTLCIAPECGSMLEGSFDVGETPGETCHADDPRRLDADAPH